MLNIIDAAEWAAIRETSERWDTFLQAVGLTEESQTSSRQQAAPMLKLHEFIPCIKAELELYIVDEVEVRQYASMFADILHKLSTDIQGTFEEAWRNLPGEGQGLRLSQNALTQLHTRGFLEAIAGHKKTLFEKLQTIVKPDRGDSTGGRVGEWTDNTRALMEEVYQQHPKLEAHEKKLLAEVSGLSLRQISIWFANQRQRRGWPLQQEDSIIEEAQEEHQESSAASFRSSQLSSSTSSSIERCPSPLTPVSINSACPSLSSSTSSRTSSDSWSNPFSPVHPPTAPFQFGSLLPASQAPIFEFSQPVPPPAFDIDQLLRQLTPPQATTPDNIHNTITTVATPTEEAAKGPFAFKKEDTDTSMSTQTTPPCSMESFQWLPINMQGLLPQTDATLSSSQILDDFTPQASQTVFAPLQLDTSQYLRQSPSANVDLSSIIDSLNTDDFWSTFASSNNIPSLPSTDILVPPKRQKGNDGVAIAQFDADWSDALFKDIDTWGKPPQLAQPQLQL